MTSGAPTDAPPTTPTDPPLECDLVMKGGVTSGVVYPLAVHELAQVYRLRQVGGASAGAIAAAAAAAAEVGRSSGGFERLAALPESLAERVEGTSRLFSLFRPQRSMRRLFRLVTAGLGSLGMPRARAVLRAAVTAYLPHALVGAAPGLLVAVLGVVLGGGAAWLAVPAGLVLAVVGVVVGVGLGLFLDVRRVPTAGFGLCDGMTEDEQQALTPWLHEVLQTLGGRSVDDPPLTFGDLGATGTTLRLMTTNLTRRQPTRMPWAGGGYRFDPREMRRLFPEAVVRHLETRVPTPTEAPDAAWLDALDDAQTPLLRFPEPDDLPVLVAVRMSLSFPGLISAVPLHAVDLSRQDNAQARAAAHAWRERHPGGTPEQAARELPPVRWQVNWFSDGGICANLPLHFFDSALPVRPTFAIDLTDFPPDRARSADELENSWLPTRHDEARIRRQTVWPTAGLGALVQFGFAIVETARTWVDEAQLEMPGYRDRIVTVFTAADEGGLNLDMPPGRVRALSVRGRGAARRLVARFAGPEPGAVPGAGWDDHRWIRFRTATAGLSDWLRQLRHGYDVQRPGTTPYSTWVGVDDAGREADAPLPSYPLDAERRHAVNLRTASLLGTATEWQRPPADAFTAGAPEPHPVLRLVPADLAEDPTP